MTVDQLSEQVAAGAPLAAKTVPEAFQRVVALRPDDVAIRTIGGEVSLTWSQLADRVRSIAAGLAGLGVGRGDTVAMLLKNTPDCHAVDLAATHIGAIPFAIFNSSPAAQIEYQLRTADAEVVIVERDFLPKVQEAAAALDGLVRHIVVVDGEPVDGIPTLAEVEAAGDPALDIEGIWRSLSEDDLVTLIFTSGTTGPPKCALWSHRTVLTQQRGLDASLPMPKENLVSFLPMAHAGGRITVHYIALAYGATILTCPDIRQLPQHIADARPDVFFSVPRMWEKLQVGIEAMVEGLPDDGTRQAARDAVQAGLRRVRAEDGGTGIAVDPEQAAELAEAHDAGVALLRPLLARIGLDRVKAGFIGGAPCAPELVQFFRAVGVPLLEAYGSTEASLNVFNRTDDFKTGTAGRALDGVELKVAEDGELLARSDMNFVGYRKQPEETAATLDSEGWLHTGDIVRLDDDGYLTVVDRKKEIIINAAGKNMSPANIESAIKGESSLIGQVVAIGDRRRFVTALITLDPEAVPVYLSRLGVENPSLADAASSPELRAEIDAAVARGNARLNSNEQIKRFALIPTAWAPDSDELTPTAKIKRRMIHAKYAEQIEQLYAD